MWTVRPWLLALAAAACTPSSPLPEDGAPAARATAPSPVTTSVASPRATTRVCVVRDEWGATVYEHSHQGLILSVRPLDPADVGGRTWTYRRDGFGRIDGIEVEPPDGDALRIEDGKLRWVREADGRVRTWAWDGDLVVKTYDNPGPGDDGPPREERRVYDDDGRLFSRDASPDGLAEEWTWRGGEVETYTSRGEEGSRGLEWREWDDEGRPVAGVWWSQSRYETERSDHTDVDVLRDGNGAIVERVETRRDGSLEVRSIWQRGPHGVVEAWVEDDLGQVHSWGAWDWDDRGRMVRADDDGGLREWTWSESGALLAYVHDGRETTFEGDCRSAARPYLPPDIEPVLVAVPGPILEPLPGLFQSR
jgi:hypothetical protein